MKALRTPDSRFEDLPGYSFEPHYLNVSDGEGGELRLHYLDEGREDGLPILLLHGEPSWSFLYRKMIPGLVDAGFRVVAPDLIGFGRSDKPVQRDDYTYQRHVDWMTEWLEKLDLRQTVLFCQDWGGLIGLRLVAEHSERFSGIVVANTFLPTGDVEPSEAFLNWQNFSQTVPEFPVGGIIEGATESVLSDDVIAGYDAPFPDESFKAGARQFPMLVPTTPENPASQANRDAWKVLAGLDIPFLTAFSDKDPITKGGDIAFQKAITAAQGQKHITIEGGGHFLQEDKGEELARVVADFVRENNLAGVRDE